MLSSKERLPATASFNNDADQNFNYSPNEHIDTKSGIYSYFWTDMSLKLDGLVLDVVNWLSLA
jgi:hypothetical protein